MTARIWHLRQIEPPSAEGENMKTILEALNRKRSRAETGGVGWRAGFWGKAGG